MSHATLEKLLIGESKAMRELRQLIVRIAPLPIPVLIEGPTGVGKELVASGLHLASGRPGKFVPVNVCAFSPGTLESDLFGHRRGAFTGAVADRAGILAEAHRGTIFLDDIVELSGAVQVKLLRAIETHVFRPVGGSEDRSSDFRVVAATNLPLADAVERGQFRLDLLHRLRGVMVTVPPLTARQQDIRPLVRHFANQMAAVRGTEIRVTDDAVQLMEQQPWPGNVRELRHVIECAVAWAQDGAIDVATLNESRQATSGRVVVPANEGPARRDLLDVLERNGWRIQAAAGELNVSPNTIYERIRKHDIAIPNRYHRRGDARTGASAPEDPVGAEQIHPDSR